jgi:predicted Zn finger-like uncharacterized protein
MRIVCPSCAAAYEVPDDKLTMGRVVRCARCHNEWSPPLNEPIAPPPPVQAPVASVFDQVAEPAAVRDETTTQDATLPDVSVARSVRLAEPAPKRGGPPLAIAWAASAVVLLLLIWAGYTWRNDIMRIWPPSTRLYLALGLSIATK